MNLAVSATALLMACVAFVVYDQVTFKERMVRGLTAQAEIVAANSVSALTFNDPDSAANTLSALKNSPTFQAVAIFTPDGQKFAEYSLSPNEQITSPPPTQTGGTDSYWFSSNRLLMAHPITFQGRTLGTVYLRSSLQVLRDRLVQYVRIAFGVLVFCLIGALLVSAAFRRALAGPISQLAETARKISKERNYSLRAAPSKNQDELSVLIESFNEMLSQIQARDVALQSERARLKALVDNAPVGILFAEAPSGRVLLGNRKVEEILRFPTLVAPDLNSYKDWPVFRADGHRLRSDEFPLYRAVKHGEIVRGEEHLFRRGDDSSVWLRSSAAPIRDKEGRIIAGVVVFNDIDDEKRAEQKLRQAYDRLAIAQVTAKMSDWDWNLVKDRVTLSAQGERQHGFPPDKFDGRFETWTQTILPEDRDKFTQAIRAAIKLRNTIEVDYRVAAADGSIRWLLSKAVIRTDEQGNPIGVLGVSMDISTLKQAQEALLQSEKLAAAGRLAASISHEINNPLESVTNLLYLVASDTQLSESTRKFVEQAEQELARVSHIATQTLRFYRQSSKPTTADVSALLDSVLSLHRGRFANMQVEVIRQYHTTDPLLCFEGELRQVFTNLVSNALDAMSGKQGRLVLRTSTTHDWKTQQPGIRITVADNGSGIPGETLARIFEPFYSTKGNRGTGLGLWVTKEIIDKHQGIMKVRSHVGSGAVFSVIFPFNGVAADQNFSDSASA
jgi:PAS domain S-box-containing protein